MHATAAAWRVLRMGCFIVAAPYETKGTDVFRALHHLL
jgi:hypothetical protein